MTKKTLSEAFKESRSRELAKDIERNKKARREAIKDNILGFIVIAFIIAVTCLLIQSIGNSRLEAIKTCVNNGNSQLYCQAHFAS